MKIKAFHITIGNATDVGKVREQNEDYMAHFVTPLGYCALVCDGMGGSAAGEEASQQAVAAIKYYLQDEKNACIAIPTALKNAIEFANYQLRELVQQNAALKGMGTTCVLALIKGAELFVAHVGDSRLYLLRNKDIQQVTRDHSTVQNLIDAGALTEKEAGQSDKRNQITKAIGIFEKVEPAITDVAIPLMQHDKILLCSDGLTAHVNRQIIKSTISSARDVQVAAMQLIAKANDNGGTDNITVQLIQYTGRSFDKPGKSRLKKYMMVTILFLLVAVGGIFAYKEVMFTKSKSNTDYPTQQDTSRSIIRSAGATDSPPKKSMKNNSMPKVKTNDSQKK